jgi:hypothetical protein
MVSGPLLRLVTRDGTAYAIRLDLIHQEVNRRRRESETYESIADLAGVDRSTLWRLLFGHGVALGTIRQIIGGLGLDAEQVIEIEPTKPPMEGARLPQILDREVGPGPPGRPWWTRQLQAALLGLTVLAMVAATLNDHSLLLHFRVGALNPLIDIGVVLVAVSGFWPWLAVSLVLNGLYQLGLLSAGRTLSEVVTQIVFIVVLTVLMRLLIRYHRVQLEQEVDRALQPGESEL